MRHAYIVDYVRTPIGRYGGSLAAVRTDDLAAIPIRVIVDRSPAPADAIDDVYFGSTNQAGEDSRNVARMAALLAGLPDTVPGCTINRLCGSGMESVVQAARAIAVGEADLVVAGGVESMSRAPFVIPKPEVAYPMSAEIVATHLGWRQTNPKMEEMGHTDPLGITAENVAAEFAISRADQDALAARSQLRAEIAAKDGRLAEEITPVTVAQRRGDDLVVDRDEHPRPGTSIEDLSRLRPAFLEGGSVTAGNSSGINDGAAALLIASPEAMERHGLTPIARFGTSATAGVPPRIMGIGPVPATQRLLARTGVKIGEIDVIEINEAFASQVLASMRQLGLPDDADHVNPNGGAIALGHPTGMTGARLVGTAALELIRRDGKLALATMCVGVGQGISTFIERP